MSKFKAAKEAGKLFEYYFDRLLRGFRKDQGREPENLEMILIRQEAGNKAREADKVIEVQFGRPFNEEINKLIESGDIKIGEVTKKNDNVLTREMFQNSNLNKPTIEGQMEKITGASNRIDEIIKEQADMYRPKTDAEIKAKYDKENKESIQKFKDKMKKEEPEDKADGGRAGYSLGSMVSQARQDSDGIEARLEQLGGDVTSAEQMLQQINERLESAGSSIPEGGGISHDQWVDTPAVPAGGIGGLASSVQTPDPFFGKNPFNNGYLGSPLGPGKIDNQGQPKQLPSIVDDNRFRDPVTGGGQPFFMGNMNPSSADPQTEKLTPLGGDNNGFTFRQEGDMGRYIADNDPGGLMAGYSSYQDYLGAGNDPVSRPQGPQPLQSASSQENLQKALPGLFAQGGRAGFYTGGITDVEPSLDDIGHGSDSLMARTRLMSPGGQATTSTGLNYLLAEDNDNIRVPFAKGKIAKEVLDKGRRGFMKAAGAAGAGIAALKTGLLGFGEKAAPVAKEVVETVSETAKGVPPYFYRLVEKIRFMGDDTLASQDKAIAKKYKDYIMEEDFQGNITIIKKGSDDMYPEDVYMSYKVDDVALRDKDGFTKAEEYEEFTARPDMDGKMKDVEPGVPDEVIEEAGDIDAMTLKKADGGRIGYSKGKAVLGFLEIIKDPKKIREAIDNIFKTGDYKMDAEMAAESLVELNPQAFGNKLYDDLDDKTRMQVYGAVIDDVMGDVSKKIKEKKTDTYKFLKKVFGESLDDMPDRDPELYQGLKEVTPIFRQKDKAKKKQELIMYMQKYLPHMNDTEIEEFIVGSRPDIEGLSGQLLRLGSGRDYAGKIKMMKEAENLRKLEDFDIEGVSKNAEGGRVPYFKGGITALKGILNYFAEQAGKKGSDQLKDINPKVLDSGIANVMGPEHLKMLQENQTNYLESLLGVIKSDKKFVDNVKNRIKEMVKTAPKGFEDVAEKIGKQMVQSSMKDKRFDRMKVYDKINIDDAIVDIEQMIKNRRVKESDGRALNASGGIQTMLGE